MDQRGFPAVGIPVATTEGAATSLAAAIIRLPFHGPTLLVGR
jgi:hypothetical protein